MAAYSEYSHITLKTFPSGIPRAYAGHIRKTSKNEFIIPLQGPLPHLILTHCSDPEVRRRLFVALNYGSQKGLGKLEDMLKARQNLADLLGKESYGHIYLADKMAESPGVFSFPLQPLIMTES